MTVEDDEYLKPSRQRPFKKKDKPHERRDHPLHQPYERDDSWKHHIEDELHDDE